MSHETPNASDPGGELKIAQHRLEQTFLASPLAMMEADTKGVITRWNPAAEQIFGWTAAEAIGQNAIELLVPGLVREHVEGNVTGWLSQREDTTEQTQAAAKLAEAEAYQKTIFGAMSDVVLVFDADAVKLLGAQVIITGIRPEVAQTLVGLGLDLGGILTLATLQSGITHALGRR